MTPEQILELAHRWGVLYGDVHVGYWRFTEEELLAFAQAVIEEERNTHGITVPLAVWDKLKDVNTVRDLIKALKSAEE